MFAVAETRVVSSPRKFEDVSLAQLHRLFFASSSLLLTRRRRALGGTRRDGKRSDDDAHVIKYAFSPTQMRVTSFVDKHKQKCNFVLLRRRR
jgi:hypothetical protein